MKRIVLPLGVGLACLLAVGWVARPRAEGRKPDAAALPAPPLPPRPGEVPKYAAQGVSTCASMSCHNGNDLVVKKGSEYSVWVAVDPHVKAYRVLLEPRSTRMQEIL